MSLKVETLKLHYRHPYRSVEVIHSNKRFVRVSINGQYRLGKHYHDVNRYANPGWSFGLEKVHITWTLVYERYVDFSMYPIYYMDNPPPVLAQGKQTLKESHTYYDEHAANLGLNPTFELKPGDVLKMWRTYK